MDSPSGFFDAHFGSPEMKLVLAGCRKLTGSIEDAEWEKRLSEPCDEARFFDLCRSNRVSLVINKTLVRPGLIRFSDGAAHGFASESRRLAMSQLRLAKSMVEVHRAFQAGNIRHAFLKGPVLGGLLFGNEMLRSSGDVDVLVEPENIRRAIASLEESGFAMVNPREKARLDTPFFGMRRKDITFRKGGTGPSIELHWKTEKVETILDRGIFDWGIHIDYAPIQVESMPMLEDYHNCLYLCLHAAKHHWMRLQWLLDIALLMQRRGIDCARLFALARKYRLLHVVQEAFYLCDRLLKLSFGIEEGSPSERHAAGLFRRFHLANQPSSPGVSRRIVFHRSRLYPMNGPRQKYLLQWILERAIGRISRRGRSSASINPNQFF